VWGAGLEGGRRVVGVTRGTLPPLWFAGVLSTGSAVGAQLCHKSLSAPSARTLLSSCWVKNQFPCVHRQVAAGVAVCFSLPFFLLPLITKGQFARTVPYPWKIRHRSLKEDRYSIWRYSFNFYLNHRVTL
jgi:hypothetical protein